MRKDKKGTETISGVFQGSGRGYGFLSPEGGKSREDDWFLPPGSTGGAWHGDSVLAEPVEEASGEGWLRPEDQGGVPDAVLWAKRRELRG